jgi:hypothetical protein
VVPISNPTLDTALVVGAAYFYAQTKEQKKVQPASVTGGGAMYWLEAYTWRTSR